MKADIDRVTKLLTDTVMLLCKNGLNYDRELKIQGLLAITLDKDDVFVVQISETCENPTAGQLNEKSVPYSDKPSSDKQASRKRVTPTTSRDSRPSEEVVDLTRLPETPLVELPMGHSRNANFQRHPLPPPTNNAMTMMCPPSLTGTSSLQSSRGVGFPIGSCWPLGSNQFLDTSGLNRFPNVVPPHNFGFGVRDETFADQNNLQMPMSYWTNMRQPNLSGFHCPLPVNKPSRDLGVPNPRWQYNSPNFTMPNAVPNNLRMMGPRHSSQRGLEKLSYATDAVPSYGGTATDGNFRIPVCAPRHRQPSQTTAVALTQLPVERHTTPIENQNRCTSRLRDAGLSQCVVSSTASTDRSKISNAAAGADDCSRFASVTSNLTGVMSCAGRPSEPIPGCVVSPVIKPCLSPVPGSSNNDPLDLSDGVHTNNRNTGSTSAPLPGTDPSDQLTNSFQSTSSSVKCISELVNHISEVVSRDSRLMDRVSSPVIHVSKSVNLISQSADHDSNVPSISSERSPEYAIVTIIPDDIDDVDEPDAFSLNEDPPDVKIPTTDGVNECNAPETGRMTQEIIGVTQSDPQNLVSELNQGITHDNMPQIINDRTTGLHMNNDVLEPADHATCSGTTGEYSEAGNAQVNERHSTEVTQLETHVPTQNDIMKDLPVLTKVVPTETTNRKPAGLDALIVECSISLEQMPTLRKSQSWSTTFHDEGEAEEEALMEETSLANPCISLTSTRIVDTGVSVDPETNVASIRGTLEDPTGRSQCVNFTTEHATTSIHHPSETTDLIDVSGAMDQTPETQSLTSELLDNPTRVIKQSLILENPSKASDHTFVFTNLLPTASAQPSEVMDDPMIESENPSDALRDPSEHSDPPLIELIDPSNVLPLTRTTDLSPTASSVFSCKSKDCPMTYSIASDLAFHYIYQHPELIANDLISGNNKSRSHSVTGNAYAKSLRASTARKREYSEQTRGHRDPSLVLQCATIGKFVHHRPKNFPCPIVGCMKKYSSEKRLSNHLQIFHRKHQSNFRQLNISHLLNSNTMDSATGADDLKADSSQQSNDGSFLCPKAGCTKKYSSGKRLSNHLWICHREHPTNLEQVNSSNLQSDSEMDSSVAADNLEANNLDDSEQSCGRDCDLEQKQSCSKNKSYGEVFPNILSVVEGSTSILPGVSSTPVV